MIQRLTTTSTVDWFGGHCNYCSPTAKAFSSAMRTYKYLAGISPADMWSR